MRAMRLVGGGLVSMVLAGCGGPAFPVTLFSVEASQADFPVMVSRAPTSGGGRPVEASSGMHSAQSSSSYRIGNTMVTVTHREHGQSEQGAASKLTGQVLRKDRWLQLDRAVFTANDFSTYGASSADRQLDLAGTVHQ